MKLKVKKITTLFWLNLAQKLALFKLDHLMYFCSPRSTIRIHSEHHWSLFLLLSPLLTHVPAVQGL
jgi:hypothetical protein